VIRFAEAIENGKLPLSPKIQMSSSGEKGNFNRLVEMLLTMLVSDKVAQMTAPDPIPCLSSSSFPDSRA
jgi:hypothetical protein